MPSFNSSFIRLSNGKLVLKAGNNIFHLSSDFNGRARMNVNNLPSNYLLEFKLRKLQLQVTFI